LAPPEEKPFSKPVIWNKEFCRTIRQEEWGTGYVPQSMVSKEDPPWDAKGADRDVSR